MDPVFQPPAFDRLSVLDGGMGSCIETLGFEASKTVAWSSGANITHPELVLAAHSAFIIAGAKVILTNTYQANIKRLSQAMSPAEALAYVDKGVELAVAAVKESRRPVHIVGSIGPYATFLADGSEYTGSYVGNPAFDRELIYHNYMAQARALHAKGVRMLAFETIPTVVEASYARRVLEELQCDGWISAQCRDFEHLANYDKYVDFVKAVADSPRVKAIGINCSSPEHVGSLLKHGQPATNGKPFVVYPNSGEDYDGQTKSFYGNKCVGKVLNELETWTKLGVRLIGGCCRVLPQDLDKITDRVAELRN